MRARGRLTRREKRLFISLAPCRRSAMVDPRSFCVLRLAMCLLLASCLGQHAAAQPAEIYVNQELGTASDADCATHGATPQAPLRTVGGAVACAFQKAGDVSIVVLCTRP